MSELTKSVPPNSSINSSESNRKKTVGITLGQDLLSIARENRINLSKLLESSLI
jgi:post-segregation antitoxin (ccd killing protein)